MPILRKLENETMILESLTVGPLETNCIIMGDEGTREAIVIDPGVEVDRIHQRLTELGLTVKQIIITHAHIDHIGAALSLKKLTGAPILLNENDLPLLDKIDEQASLLGLAAPETAPPDGNLAEGQCVGLENYPARVLLTPGHTPGSICLLFAPLDLLFSGDTLYAGSIGRTDQFGGDYDRIIDSIQSRLFTLPDATQVLPGHGPNTTIGQERSSNPLQP
jgi:glyoxylase-like metal-dependent hydrolase (beta-lactamase superfamily II)